MKKSYESMVREFVAREGIEFKVSRISAGLDLDAWAPEGKRFIASDCHTVVSSAWGGETDALLWKDMYEQLSYGLELCPADCDCKTGELEKVRAVVDNVKKASHSDEN